MHTSWSFDAYINSVRTHPRDAYRYALGEEVPLAGGEISKIDRPLDFMAVTDHAEFLGVVRHMADPDHPISKHPQAKAITSGKPALARMAFLQLSSAAANGEAAVDESYLKEPDELATLWQEMVDVADEFYAPGKFTTFAGFEWSSTYKFVNQHRNVIFRDTSNVSHQPYSMLDSHRPEDLWAWMDKEREDGVELMAIPHNANMSKGQMYPLKDTFGNPIDRRYAETRRRNEPANEVNQIKGQSMTHPFLDSTDEFAEFELYNFTIANAADESTGVDPGSYARQGLQRGLEFKESIGINPFKFGIIGSSDSHNSNSPAVEATYTGSAGIRDSQRKVRLASNDPKIIKRGSGGLAGVWADQNTRESIYDAIARRETFSTTGPRIQVRMFAGYEFESSHVSMATMAQDGYANGVPMGADLTEVTDESPTFLVWAIKDTESANLDRIQIIKGWLEKGKTQERTYNVALSDGRTVAADGTVPDNGATVDLSTGEYSNDVGAVQLMAQWRDPDFEPKQEAYYFTRVLENPTPRWSTVQARAEGMALPDEVPSIIRERAWSSPIWYSPNE